MRARNCTGLTQVIGGNIIPPDIWVRVPDDLAYEHAFDAEKNRILELEITPEDGGIWKDNDGTHILWRSPFSQGDGYATAAEATALALLRVGLKVRFQYSWFLEETGLDPITVQKLKESDYRRYQVGVCMATPGEFRKLFTPYRIGLTMYEADDPLQIHPEWRHDCRQVDRIIVPSEYCKDVFSFYGGQIDVCPLSTNPVYYVAQRRQPKDTFNICTYATLTGRKAPLETLEMFKRAFPKGEYPDVRMTFKTRMGYFGWGRYQVPPVDDERIKIISTRENGIPDWTAEELRDWLLRGQKYGRPSLRSARYPYKKLRAMEEALVINWLTRAFARLVFKLDTTGLSDKEAQGKLTEFKRSLSRRDVAVGVQGFERLTVAKDIVMGAKRVLRGGKWEESLDDVSILDTSNTGFWNITAVEYWRNKFITATGVPKAHLGLEKEINAKATLQWQDQRFARMVRRLQMVMSGFIRELIDRQLTMLGIKDVQYVISWPEPSVIDDKEKSEMYQAYAQAADVLLRNEIASPEWIATNFFKMTPAQIKASEAWFKAHPKEEPNAVQQGNDTGQAER